MKKPFTLIAAALLLAAFQQNPVHADGVPEFKVDPFWPKPLPERWVDLIRYLDEKERRQASAAEAETEPREPGERSNSAKPH